MRIRNRFRFLTLFAMVPAALMSCSVKANKADTDWWAVWNDSWCDYERSYLAEIQSEPYYAGNKNGPVDPKAHRAAMQASRALRDLLGRQMSVSRDIGRNDSETAVCAIRELHFWAQNDALLGNNTMRGFYERYWYSAGIGIAYAESRVLLAQAGQDVPDEIDRTIVNWLVDLGNSARRAMNNSPRDFDKRSETPSFRPSPHLAETNLGLWVGYYAIVAGSTANDLDLMRWGKGVQGAVLAKANGDGSLPMELDRKQRALHYHYFALNPLVGGAILLDRAGIPFDRSERTAIDRLVDYTLAQTANPAGIRRAASTNRIEHPLRNGSWKSSFVGIALWCDYLADDRSRCRSLPPRDELNFNYMGGSTEPWEVVGYR